MKTKRPVAALCQRRPRRSQTAATKKAERGTPCAPALNGRAAARRGLTRPTTLRQEFRAWRAALPTALERDTLLMPDAIAASVVQEAERFLKADLPANFAERLAAKAYYLYPRHKHFQKLLKAPGNRGRNHLYMYMRHWTAAWLKREHYALYQKLPRSFGLGQPLFERPFTLYRR